MGGVGGEPSRGAAAAAAIAACFAARCTGARPGHRTKVALKSLCSGMAGSTVAAGCCGERETTGVADQLSTPARVVLLDTVVVVVSSCCTLGLYSN